MDSTYLLIFGELKLDLQRRQHGQGGVLLLVEHGDNGLVAARVFRVRIDIVGADIRGHKVSNGGSHLADLDFPFGSSVKVRVSTMTTAAAATVSFGKLDLDLDGNIVSEAQGPESPLDLGEVLNEIGVLNAEELDDTAESSVSCSEPILGGICVSYYDLSDFLVF